MSTALGPEQRAREGLANCRTKMPRVFWHWLMDEASVSDEELAALGLLRHARHRSPIASARRTASCGRIEVHSVRPVRRVSPDGNILSDLVVEITQSFRPKDRPGMRVPRRLHPDHRSGEPRKSATWCARKSTVRGGLDNRKLGCRRQQRPAWQQLLHGRGSRPRALCHDPSRAWIGEAVGASTEEEVGKKIESEAAGSVPLQKAAAKRAAGGRVAARRRCRGRCARGLSRENQDVSAGARRLLPDLAAPRGWKQPAISRHDRLRRRSRNVRSRHHHDRRWSSDIVQPTTGGRSTCSSPPTSIGISLSGFVQAKDVVRQV